MTTYDALPLYPLPGPLSCFEPSQELPARVEEHSPAVLVMTDLRFQNAVSVEPNVTIDWALERMKTVGVRLLFVTNSDNEILGLITSTDILGEKPMQFQQQLNIRYEEIIVRDIMTPAEALEVLLMEDVQRRSVGDIVATLRSLGRRHALVMDYDQRRGAQAIRGIFSASQIARQLDQIVETTPVAHTFAEVEMALNN